MAFPTDWKWGAILGIFGGGLAWTVANWGSLKEIGKDASCLLALHKFCEEKINNDDEVFNNKELIAEDVRKNHNAKCIVSLQEMILDSHDRQGIANNRHTVIFVNFSEESDCSRYGQNDITVKKTKAAVYGYREKVWKSIRLYKDAEEYFISGPLIGSRSGNQYKVIWIRPEQDLEISEDIIDERGWGFSWVNDRAFVRNGNIIKVYQLKGDELFQRNSDDESFCNGCGLSSEDMERLKSIINIQNIELASDYLQINNKNFQNSPVEWLDYQGYEHKSSLSSIYFSEAERILFLGSGECVLSDVKLEPDHLGSWKIPDALKWKMIEAGPFDSTPSLRCWSEGSEKKGNRDGDPTHIIWLLPRGASPPSPALAGKSGEK